MTATKASPIQVVIVDARPDDYDALRRQTDASAYQLQFVDCGEEALRLPRQSPPDLWLINTRLPDMAGAELLATFRGIDRGATYGLVGDAYYPEDEVAARRAGAALYLCKPPQTDWLRVCTARRPGVLAAHSAHGPPPVAPSSCQPPARASPKTNGAKPDL